MIDEIRTILIEGGATDPIRIDRDVNGWLVSAFFGPVQHLGHTGISKETSDDPRDLARRLVAIATDYQSPAPGGVFDLEIIEPEQTDEPTDGLAGPESMVYEGSPLEASEPAYDDPGSAMGEAENVSYPDDPDLGDAVDEPELVPANFGGVLVSGDALATAKAIALMAVDDERFARVGDYDKTANQSRLDELRAIQQAIREGVHPQFTDIETQELQALETFLPWIQRIDDHAQALRNEIRAADDLEVLTAIDLLNGWPE